MTVFYKKILFNYCFKNEKILYVLQKLTNMKKVNVISPQKKNCTILFYSIVFTNFDINLIIVKEKTTYIHISFFQFGFT